MNPQPRVAAGFALLSVFFFAVSSHLTAALVPNTSVITVMSFRTLLGSLVLLLYVAIFEKKFYFEIFLSAHFWWWTLVFDTTLLLYGLAFAARSVDDVLIIAATMPLIVITVEYIINRASFRRSMLAPVALMFGAAISPSIYRIATGQTMLVLSFGSLFAVGATVCHAAWIILGRTVQKNNAEATTIGAALAMFLVGGVFLIVLSDFAYIQHAEQFIRGPGFRVAFWSYAAIGDRLTLCSAGILSALSVLLIINAIKRDAPSNIVPYQYTLAIWSLLLTLLFGIHDPTQTSDMLWVMAVASITIFAGALWLHSQRTT